MILFQVEDLLKYAQYHNLINEFDIYYARNYLYDLLKITDEPVSVSNFDKSAHVSDLLAPLIQYAKQTNLINDTPEQSELFENRLASVLMPMPGEVIGKFNSIKKSDGIQAATDWFYTICKITNYIRTKDIARNIVWKHESPYAELTVTINLTKPEKDPKDIALAKMQKQSNYPKCMLCLENIGYTGRLGYPGRQNLRVIPFEMNHEEWNFQFSPYVYYNQHGIVLSKQHYPMAIDKNSFVRLLEFLDIFPHYFIGSNACLPIVGGSILSHNHFQCGLEKLPMFFADKKLKFKYQHNSDIDISILNWPMSVIQLESADKETLVAVSADILKKWQAYSDESVEIYSHTGDTPHNDITPITRKNDDKYIFYLVLRNNRTNEQHPDGIFHPHRKYHNIKKENIGLIEVMGLFILPGRLARELSAISDVLTGSTEPMTSNPDDMLYKHNEWISKLKQKYDGRNDIMTVMQHEIGQICVQILKNAGVFKEDKNGTEAFARFMTYCGFIPTKE